MPVETTGVERPEIRMKIAYSGQVYITYIPPGLQLTDLRLEIKTTCKFDPLQESTLKWVDEDGDPCTISSQYELDEALRLYEVNKDSELTVHVFPNVPEPGMPCQGEDRQKIPIELHFSDMNGVYDGQGAKRFRNRPRPLSQVLIGCIQPSAERKTSSTSMFKRSSSRADIIDCEWQFSKEYPPPEGAEDATKDEYRDPLPNEKIAKSASFAAAGFNAMKQRSKSLLSMLTLSSSKNQQQGKFIGRESKIIKGHKAPPSRHVNDLRIRRDDLISSDFWEWSSNSSSKSSKNSSVKSPSPKSINSSNKPKLGFQNGNIPPSRLGSNNVTMEIPFIDASPNSRRRVCGNGDVVMCKSSSVDPNESPLLTSTLKNDHKTNMYVPYGNYVPTVVNKPNFVGSVNIVTDSSGKSRNESDYRKFHRVYGENNKPLHVRPSHLMSYTQRIESIESSSSYFGSSSSNSMDPPIVASISEKISSCTVTSPSKIYDRRSAKVRLYSKPDPPVARERCRSNLKNQRPNSFCDFERNPSSLNFPGQVTYPPYSENVGKRLELNCARGSAAASHRVPFCEDVLSFRVPNKNENDLNAGGAVSKLEETSNGFSCYKRVDHVSAVSGRRECSLNQCSKHDNSPNRPNTNYLLMKSASSNSNQICHVTAGRRTSVEGATDSISYNKKRLMFRESRPLSVPNLRTQSSKSSNSCGTAPQDVRNEILQSNRDSYEEEFELELKCSIYRRGARRWRKHYKINGHIFQAKRFNRRASCAFCKDRIWGLGRQGFKCTQCKLLVHKKCSKLQHIPCNNDLDTSCDTLTSHESSTTSRPGSNGGIYITNEFALKEGIGAGMTEETIVETPVSLDSNSGSAPNAVASANATPAGQFSMDDFELIRVIGRGSYAKVLMVELKTNNRIYAMKVIKKTLVADDEDIDWVQTEKHVFETASNHPFLVGLHSCFQTPSRLFFVIEFVRGGDLMFHMQRQRRLPEEHARFYAAEICLALNFLHEKGIIYRDLKLDNVLLDHEGHIKLTDYGMCKEGIRPRDTTSTFCGTPNYIAPEILQGEEYSFSVDWWALGVLLYEMLAGKSPFDIVGATENPDTNTEDFLFQVILERPIRIPRSLSVKAASILKGFLNKNPVDRLGCHLDTGFNDIVTHIFFKSMDWEMLEQRQVTPPYRPRLEGDRDLANFPPEFTDEPIQLTPDDPREIENLDQTEFEGFEYVNPLLMSMEDCV